jgi:hypothetical protein
LAGQDGHLDDAQLEELCFGKNFLGLIVHQRERHMGVVVVGEVWVRLKAIRC